MLSLPQGYDTLLCHFAPVFSRRVWQHARVLLLGAILAHGKRTVTAALTAVGLAQEKCFQRYHRVLSRDCWSGLALSRVLLTLLVAAFATDQPLVFGIDETIERRRGNRIAAKGIYRDAVRSSASHKVLASGLRWCSLMLLSDIPFARRVWALPVLTALAPSSRYFISRGRAHKKLTDYARQMLTQLRRWLPASDILVVFDSSYAVLELLCRLLSLPKPIYAIARFRLDACLYAPPPARLPGQRGRPRVKGEGLPPLGAVLADPATNWARLSLAQWYGQVNRQIEVASDTCLWYHPGTAPLPIRWVLIRDPRGLFRSQALLCTDQAATPEQIVSWFTRRWQLEVTFAEVRAHLGVETQRQWSTLAIARTTPCLLGLFSLVTLLAHQAHLHGELVVHSTAWYQKKLPTFSDALETVRTQIRHHHYLSLSLLQPDLDIIPPRLLASLQHTLAQAA